MSTKSKSSTAFRERLQNGGLSDHLQVIIRVRRATAVTLTSEIERAIAQGQVHSRLDYEATRGRLLAERVSLTTRQLCRVRDVILAGEGDIRFAGSLSPVIIANLDIRTIRRLLQLDEVEGIEEEPSATPEYFRETISMGEQFDQYIEPDSVPFWTLGIPYDGSHGDDYLGDIPVALSVGIIDGATNSNHPAFFTDGSKNVSRIVGHYGCNNAKSACSPKASPCFGDCGTDHGTSVAGLIIGDHTHGQDVQNKYTGWNARQTSGMARRARAHIYDIAPSFGQADYGQGAAAIAAIQHVMTISPKPTAVNMSQGFSWGFPDSCNGNDPMSVTVNDLFEHGILLIKSAGNAAAEEGIGVCSVTPPGSAIGAFTVGNYIFTLSSTLNAVRFAGQIAPNSSRGGVSDDYAHGRGRTIVDIAAYGGSSHMLSQSGGLVDPKSKESQSGTSFSTPLVTAAAVVITDHYVRVVESFLIQDPGVLYANLLLMGDRSAGLKGDEGQPSYKLNSGFDRGYGAGRMKLRKFDSFAASPLDLGGGWQLSLGRGGMSPPWGYSSGVGCISSGESLQIYLNNGEPLPSGADVLKYVIWWYDRRHESIGDSPLEGIANIDVFLWGCDEKLQPVTILASSESPTDNKERIFYAPPGGIGGKRLMIEIRAVSGIVPEYQYGNCKPGFIRVYDAYFWESSARQISGLRWEKGIVDGTPSWTGVEPEDLPSPFNDL
ncbi:MAG: S8 family serine peptidase [Myxococcales bacterium]|nr:S8 family serine peptidase [Myxococcales bacterium]